MIPQKPIENHIWSSDTLEILTFKDPLSLVYFCKTATILPYDNLYQP